MFFEDIFEEWDHKIHIKEGHKWKATFKTKDEFLNG